MEMESLRNTTTHYPTPSWFRISNSLYSLFSLYIYVRLDMISSINMQNNNQITSDQASLVTNFLVRLYSGEDDSTLGV